MEFPTQVVLAVVSLDQDALADPARLEAVERARKTLPNLSIPIDAISGLAARLLKAPMAAVSLVDCTEEFFAAGHGLPDGISRGRLPLSDSLCRYVVSADGVAGSTDLQSEYDPALRHHRLATEYGIRSFLGAPVRDEDHHPVGSLIVFDAVPRSWTGQETSTLVELAQLLSGKCERVAAEESADRNAGFLAALLDSLSVGVLACDSSGRIVLLNRALREVQGLPATGEVLADFPTLAAGVLYDSDLQPLPWERMPIVRAQSGEYVNTDIVVVVPGERIRTFAVTAQPITATEGVPMGAVAVTHEVTALRRAEHFRACHINVERSLAQAASIVEAAPAVLRTVVTALGWTSAELFLIDTSTGDLRPTGHWGVPGFEPERFFNHSPVKGAGVTGRVWETGRPVWIQDIAVAKDMKTPFDKARADVCVRNGVRTILSVPVRDGGLLGVLTCYAATTENHEDLFTVLLDGVAAQIGTFVALRHADQLTLQLERTQDDFIALVGHELRTPLTSISAYASLLADGSGNLDDDSRHMLSGISRNSHELVEIVGRLLEVAGLEAGHLPLDIQRVDLSAIITDAVTAVQTAAAARRIRLRADARIPGIEADAHRLRQAIDDLISNAIKYTPDGGEICIRADQGNGATRIQVTDTGIGVAAADRSRVFDRFYRGGNVRHQGTPGSGLGLSRARTIVKLHGGTIGLLDNHPGGTIALISLPTTQPDPQPSTKYSSGYPLLPTTAIAD